MKLNIDTKLVVSPSPHVRSSITTAEIMRDVVIALIPAGIVGVAYYGVHAAFLILMSVFACVAFEYITRRILKRPNTIGDLSAVVTGLLLAYNVPSTLPLWMIVIGAFAAIVVVKQFFGGIGQNFVNPAIAARIVLMTSFPVYMTSFIAPYSEIDAVTTATPLSMYAQPGAPTIGQLFLGLHGGCVGEVCALAILAGFAYLLIRKVVTPTITVSFVGTVAVIMLLAGGFDFNYMIYELLSGGLLLGACFMATDYATSPINNTGRIVFGIGCGIITCLIRIFGSLAEGVSFAILLMNILTPHIENLTAPKVFGAPKKSAKKGGAKA